MASQDENITAGDEEKVRLEDGLLSVALTSADFDTAAREFLSDEDCEDDIQFLETIIFHRGELPRRGGIWVERSWWAVEMLCLLIFIYGFLCVLFKMVEFFSP